MSITETKRGPLQLSWDEKDRQITVTPDDEDRFNITVEQAILACQAVGHSMQFSSQFRNLLNLLATWSNEHASQIDAAYLTVHGPKLLFVVKKKEPRYEDAFEDELTNLDVQIANDQKFELISIDVLALPIVSEITLKSFVNMEPKKSFQIFPPKALVTQNAE